MFTSRLTFLETAEHSYRLYRCVSCGQGTYFYATRPLATHNKQLRALVGIYDQRHGSLMSILKTGSTHTSRICGLTSWRQGIVMCGPEGITYMNGSTYKFSRLLGVDIGASEFHCLGDIAVLGYDDSLWFTDTDFSFHDATASRIHCFNPTTGRLHTAATNVEVPINITFSRDSSKCFISDAASSSIFVYDVVHAEHFGYKLANCKRFVYLDSTTSALKTDKNGFVWAACESRIICWDSAGQLRGIYRLNLPVADFSVKTDRIVVFQSQEIVELDLLDAELDARL